MDMGYTLTLLSTKADKDLDEVAKLSPLAYGWGDSFPTTTYVWTHIHSDC